MICDKKTRKILQKVNKHKFRFFFKGKNLLRYKIKKIKRIENRIRRVLRKLNYGVFNGDPACDWTKKIIYVDDNNYMRASYSIYYYIYFHEICHATAEILRPELKSSYLIAYPWEFHDYTNVYRNKEAVQEELIAEVFAHMMGEIFKYNDRLSNLWFMDKIKLFCDKNCGTYYSRFYHQRMMTVAIKEAKKAAKFVLSL